MLEPLLYTSAIFVCMVVMLEAGRQLHRRHKAAGDGVPEGVGTLEGAVFGLFGLLLAFSFSGAVDRFSARRTLIVQESKTIGGAWQLLDLLPEKERESQRALFRKYVDGRIAAYRTLPDIAAFKSALKTADGVYDRIWADAVASSLDPRRAVDYSQVLLPHLREMSEIAFDRTAAFQNHPPAAILGMLFVLALMSSLLAGYTLGDHEGRRSIHRFIFAVAVALTVYVTIDLEYPRFGLIRVDASDGYLQQLRETMK